MAQWGELPIVKTDQVVIDKGLADSLTNFLSLLVTGVSTTSYNKSVAQRLLAKLGGKNE